MTAADALSSAARADLDAFLRCRDDVPQARRAGLAGSLSGLRGSDDPVVAFAGLPAACVPAFADGCQVELSDGAESLFRSPHAGGPAGNRGRGPAADDARPGSALLTPFQVAGRAGYPSYGGVVTHWWTGRTPAESDATIADLLVRHLIALVDRERLTAAVARAEEQAASLALRAVSGRAISIATGIVMHQHRLGPDGAEDLLRQCARTAGTSLPEVAADVLRSGSLDRWFPPSSASGLAPCLRCRSEGL